MTFEQEIMVGVMVYSIMMMTDFMMIHHHIIIKIRVRLRSRFREGGGIIFSPSPR